MHRYPSSALWLLGSSIRSAHANARHKDQPNELRAGHFRPHTPSTRDLQLQLWSSSNGQGSVCFKYVQVINDSRYFAIHCTNTPLSSFSH